MGSIYLKSDKKIGKIENKGERERERERERGGEYEKGKTQKEVEIGKRKIQGVIERKRGGMGELAGR